MYTCATERGLPWCCECSACLSLYIVCAFRQMVLEATTWHGFFWKHLFPALFHKTKNDSSWNTNYRFLRVFNCYSANSRLFLSSSVCFQLPPVLVRSCAVLLILLLTFSAVRVILSTNQSKQGRRADFPPLLLFPLGRSFGCSAAFRMVSRSPSFYWSLFVMIFSSSALTSSTCPDFRSKSNIRQNEINSIFKSVSPPISWNRSASFAFSPPFFVCFILPQNSK